jgi:type II secretory pathway pseudopilin PulG
MHRPRSSRAGGFTLLEAVIVMTLFGAVMGSVVSVVHNCTRTCQVVSASGQLEAAASRALDEIADRLQASAHTAITPSLSAPFSSSRIDFQRSTGYAGGATLWSPTERIAFQYRPGEINDGLDNDRDGIADDGQVVWIQDLGLASERTTRWADGVTEYLQGETLNNKDDNGNGLIDETGLCFTVNSSSVLVCLTLRARSADGTFVTTTAQKRVFFRNR